jgi:hypothetical protein
VKQVVEHSETTTNGLISSGDEEITSAAFDDPQTKGAAMMEEHSASPMDDPKEPEKSGLVTFEDNDAEHENTNTPESDEVGSPSETENAGIDEVDDSESIETPADEDTNELIITATNEALDQEKDDQNSREEIGIQNSIDSDNEEQAVLEFSVEPVAVDSDDQLSGEIEELLTLLGLSQSMIQVTNEMITPPEGRWEIDDGYRAIINPGGVGQPRDGDPRAAFMIYDTEHGFEFYRVPYAFEKTQEKIIKAGLPQYLAVRLEYGR